MNISKEKERAIREEKRIFDGFAYTYRLLFNEGLRNSSFGIPLYSIEIKMENIKSGAMTDARAGEIFSEERKAFLFFDKLVRNLATPIDLAYIVEDEFK